MLRIDRKAGRRHLLAKGVFTEEESEAILDVHEAAARQRLVRALRWSDLNAQANTLPPGLEAEHQKQLLLQEKLLSAGFTNAQSKALLEVAWLMWGLGTYTPGTLFPEATRQFAPGKQLTGSEALHEIAGNFRSIESRDIRVRIRPNTGTLDDHSETTPPGRSEKLLDFLDRNSQAITAVLFALAAILTALQMFQP